MDGSKSPTRFRVHAVDEDIDILKAKFAEAAPGTIVYAQFGNKSLELVKGASGGGEAAVVTLAGVGAALPAPKKRLGGKPQETQANKMMNALYEAYKKLKEDFCARRAERTGVEPRDVLLGNKTVTFQKLRREFIAKNNERREYYNASPPPTAFDKDGEAWLWHYWSRIVTDRAPRDRAAERKKREAEKRKMCAQGGSTVTGEIMSE